MGAQSGRRPLPATILFLVLIAGLSLASVACDPEEESVKQMLSGYYQAIVRNDKPAEVSFWMADRQTEATREADAWASRDRQGFELSEIHVDSGPASDQRIVHVTISTDDKARPGKRRYETRVLLLQRAGADWLIRDVR